MKLSGSRELRVAPSLPDRGVSLEVRFFGALVAGDRITADEARQLAQELLQAADTAEGKEKK